MNKIFKVIWNHTAQRFVVVSELTKSNGKSSSTTDNRIEPSKALFALGVAGAALLGSAQVMAATAAPVTDGTGKNVTSGGSPLYIHTYSNDNSIAIGGSAGSTAGVNTQPAKAATGGTAIGSTANAGEGSVAISFASNASGGNSVSIGYASSASGAAAIGIGLSVKAGGSDSIAMGRNANTTGATNGMAIGLNANATKGNAIAMGNASKAAGVSSIAIGHSATAEQYQGTAIGEEAKAIGSWATALGSGSKATGNSALASGYYADASGKRSTSVGYRATTTAENAVALGSRANATAVNSTAIGTESNATVVNSTAIGTASNATAENAIAIGTGAVASDEGSVALGNASTTRAATSENTATVGPLTYNGFAGNTPSSVVSVGSADAERQLVNVAAGKISATSTDAINGSQLYATNNVLGNVYNSTTAALGGIVTPTDGTGNYTVAFKLTGTDPSNSTPTDVTYTNISSALTALSQAVNQPLTFKGDEGTTTQELGSTLNIVAGNAADTSTRNVKTNVTAGQLEISFSDKPTFTNVTVENTLTV
ncbi:MAG: hypothetical protein MSH39_06045, partial [[Actinobacillus] rossii]|nr:hypothetical protein [[Actinobacillus] rossii]